jgi:hypothetical protein
MTTLPLGPLIHGCEIRVNNFPSLNKPAVSTVNLPFSSLLCKIFFADTSCADRRLRLAPPATPSCPATCWPTSPLLNLFFWPGFFSCIVIAFIVHQQASCIVPTWLPSEALGAWELYSLSWLIPLPPALQHRLQQVIICNLFPVVFSYCVLGWNKHIYLSTPPPKNRTKNEL